jgi:hydroxymethylbilane synthase
MSELIFATRPSALARWQTGYVMQQLQHYWPDLSCTELIITTEGDRVVDISLPEIGGKGLFTSELEQALLKGRVQAAVHSLKDLPTEDSPGLSLGAIPQRADPRDVLICPAGHSLADLPSGSIVGTSSNRRSAQILAYRPDLLIKPIRGNIDTRLRKVQAGNYDAIILAAAGMSRLGLEDQITEYLPYELMLPAPGQGALAVQCLAGDTQTLRFLQAIDHPETRVAVKAERVFLSALGGGCSLPVGAIATLNNGEITLQGVVASMDGNRILKSRAIGHDPHIVGQRLAEEALSQGAGGLLLSEAFGGQSSCEF